MAEAVRRASRDSATAEPFCSAIVQRGRGDRRRRRRRGASRASAPRPRRRGAAAVAPRSAACRARSNRSRSSGRRGSGSAAGSPRRARGSGRARRGCRRRGSADAPIRRRTFTASLSGSSVTISTGLSPSTQTSAERTPSPIEKARASPAIRDAAEAARHDAPASLASRPRRRAARRGAAPGGHPPRTAWSRASPLPGRHNRRRARRMAATSARARARRARRR